MNIPLLIATSFGCLTLTYFGGRLYTRYQEINSKQNFLPSIIAAGGGYLLAISFLELLPLSIDKHRNELHQIAGFALLGAVAVAVAHRLMRHALIFKAKSKTVSSSVMNVSLDLISNHTNLELHCEETDHHACCTPILGVPVAQAAIGCLVVCSFFDGIMVSSGFQAGERIGIGVLVGELLHLIPEGIIASSLALGSGQSSNASKNAALIVGCSFFLGSLFPFMINSQPTWAIPFSLGVALYVTLGQLLPIIKGHPETWGWLAGGTVFYFLVHLSSLGHG